MPSNPPRGRPNASRQWPAPGSPWLMKQKWHDLLFIHWPVPVGQLRPHVPARLEIETYDNSAWLGVVPFRMSGIRLHGSPPLPGASAMPELNVRTYVRAEGKPGVWFFSLDATNPLAVMAARRFFHLPYFRAAMRCQHRPGGEIVYTSRRTDAQTRSEAKPAEFRGRYAPAGDVFHARSGSIEYFLTERYCLYAEARGEILRCEIDHDPWPLAPAHSEIEVNTMAAALGVGLPATTPLLHFAGFQDVRVWRMRRIR